MTDLRLDIDPLRLDEEWLGQPGLLHRWSVAAANADAEVDAAKMRLKVVAAELELEIRNSPEQYGLTKVTESVIAAAVTANPMHKIATEKYNKAMHDAAICHAAVAAIDTRKKALEKLVDLWTRDYYSAPKAPAGVREEVSEMEKRLIRGRGVRERNGSEE